MDIKKQIEGFYPLAPMQQGMLFHTLYDPGSGVYDRQVFCTLHGDLDVPAFERAWAYVVNRHSALRTAFVWEGLTTPVQVVHRRVKLPWKVVDWRGLSPGEQDARLAAFLTDDWMSGFDVSQPPLMRLALFQVAEDAYQFVWTHHHLLLDGWSMPLVLNEVVICYEAFAQGQGVQLVPPRPYRDYINWLQQQDLAQAEAFWRQYLHGFTAPTPMQVALAPGNTPGLEEGYAEQHLHLAPATIVALKALAQQYGLTLNTLMQGAWALLLSHYSSAVDVVFGTTVAGRPPDLAGSEVMVGLFINTLPTRVRVTPDTMLPPWLQQLQAQQVALRQYEYSPLAQVQRWSAVPRGTPLFESIVVFENYPVRAATRERGSGLAVENVRAVQRTNYPLTVVAVPGPALELVIGYDCRRFDAATITRLLRHLQTLLEGIAIDSTRCLAQIPLLTAAEQQQMLVDWNATTTCYPHNQCLHQLFEAQVARTPDAIAVVFDRGQGSGASGQGDKETRRQGDSAPDTQHPTPNTRHLTYRELNARANQLAHHLRHLGVEPDARIGICVERSVELVVGLLGVLKAGGAYLPLDPAYPKERLAFMLADAQASVLLTQQAIYDLRFTIYDFPAELKTQNSKLKTPTVVCLDSERPLLAGLRRENLRHTTRPDNLAYVIYTSGSTGVPKGVMIAHRGLVNYLTWCVRAYAVAAGTGAPVHSSLAFDLTVTSLFAPLLAGQRVQLLPEARGFEALGAAVRPWANFSLVKLTPAHLDVLRQQVAPQNLAGWTHVFVVGGEALLAERTAPWHALAPSTILINEYGPTETVVGCCVYRVPRDAATMGAVPIGRPIANTQLYILDAQMQPVPVGVPGELHIGGVGLARGYLGRPDLTAERFVPNPFGEGMGDGGWGMVASPPSPIPHPPSPGTRLYKTGDLARYLPDGVIEFLGRLDQQVKIRGYRIELGEIEAALGRHAGVRDAVVLAREDVVGQKRLVAYLVLRTEGRGLSGADSSVLSPQSSVLSELRAFLVEKLPDYMIPSAFVLLDALPLTTNGKVDRRALPAPDAARPALDDLFVAPSTPAETLLAGIWSNVFGLARVGVQDNFFALGGDSILSLQIVAKAHQAGLRLTPRQLFEHQTIADLAALAGLPPAISAQQGLLEGALPLTPIQHWFFAQNLPDPQHYNQALLLIALEPLAPHLLARALQRLLLHHDALRLRFVPTPSGWRQHYLAVLPCPLLTLFDLSQLPLAAQPPVIETVASALHASLHLSAGPLVRVALFDCGAAAPARLLLIVHHLLVDGVSWRILLDDLQTLYRQLVQRQPLALAPKSSSFQRWAEQLAAYAQSETARQELTDWLELSQPAPAPLPRDLTGGANTVASARTFSVALDAAATQALLREVPAVYHTQISEVLLTALVQAWSEWSGEAALLLELEGHGREELVAELDLTRTVGWFTTLFPLRLALAPNTPPGRALQAVKTQVRAVPKRGLGYGVLRYLSQDAAVRAAMQGLPSAEVSFNYLGQVDQVLGAGALLALAREGSGVPQSQAGLRSHVLAINGLVVGGRLELVWSYSAQIHHHTTIERLAQCYLAALRGLIAHCQAPEAGGYSPADFPLTQLDQAALDRLLGADRYVEDVYPLSPLQQGILFHTLYAPESGVYANQLRCTFQGDFDSAAFQHSWQHVVDRHPILRTAFVWEGLDEPLQVVYSRATLPLEQLDWRDLAPVEQVARLEAYASPGHSIALAQAPLMRLTLIQLAEGVYHFVWSHHHLLMDGWSVSLILNEVFTSYAAFRRGEEIRFPPARPYRDYIAWLRKQDLAPAAAFWRQILQGVIAPTPLGVDHPAGQVPRATGDTEQRLQLAASTTAALQALARHHRLTLNTLVQGVWALLLSHYSGTDDVVFGATVAGRPPTLPGVETLVGLFINTLPIRVWVPPEGRLLAWLQQLQDQQVALRQYEHTPLVQIQGWSEIPRGLPLFESIVVFENYPVDMAIREQAGSLTIGNVRTVEWTNYPLTVVAVPGAALVLRISYDARRFDDVTIARLLGHVQTLLEGIVADPTRRLADLPLLTDAERQHLLGAWNATQTEFRSQESGVTRASADAWLLTSDAWCLHHLFEAQVARTPDAVALVFNRGQGSGVRGQEDTQTEDRGSTIFHPPSSILHPQSLTYAELNARANQLAHHLQALGVGPETLVGLCLERSLELVAGLLGILKAGAAYVPLDPAYPPERLAFMLDDAQVMVLITQQKIYDLRFTIYDFPATPDQPPELKTQNPGLSRVEGSKLKTPVVICLDADWATIACASAENLDGRVMSDHLAYVIYTSGSTGTPKGVLVSHANAVRLLAVTEDWFHFDSRDVWTLFHSVAFDFSVWEVWGALRYGGRLVVVPYWVSRSPDMFYDLIRAEQVTVLNQTPSAFRQLIHAEEAWVSRPEFDIFDSELHSAETATQNLKPWPEPGRRLKTQNLGSLALRLVIFGGEALDLSGLQPWFDRHGDEAPRLVNMYGITETTVHVTYRPLTAADVWAGSVIGRPIPDLQVYVLDKRRNLAPLGVAGELYVGGAGVAQGYLGRPELTAERFIPNPFEEGMGDGGRGMVASSPSPIPHPPSPGTRLYKTGDLVRYLPGGDLMYLGRIDQQVKIRGFRIELGEIEAVLRQHPAVRETVVLAWGELPGERRLVAYVVPKIEDRGLKIEDSASDAPEPLSSILYPLSSELRRFLQTKLPDYMVPAVFVLLDALPLTPHGKIDRRALPAPDQTIPALEETFVAPRTPTEEILAQIWADVLRLEQVGAHDNFFVLGGHSLLATQLISRMRAIFQVDLPLRGLFEAPSVAGLAERIESARRDALALQVPAPRPVPRDGPLPLSFAQQRLWFLDQLQPDSPVYTIPIATCLTGPLDLAMLQQSLSAIVERHEALRTTFVTVDGQPVQVITPAQTVPLPLIDLRTLPTDAREAVVQRLIADETRRSFDLARGPLFRATLLRPDDEEHVALLTMHHIVADGWSMDVLIREVGALYDAFASGQPAALPELPIQYADYAVWQREWLAGAVQEAQLAYWRARLADLPLLRLPTDRPRPPIATFQGAQHSFVLPEPLTEALTALSRAEGVTRFITLLAAWQVLLGRYSGQNDIAVGTPITGRTCAETDWLIGFFVNTLVLRTDLSGNPTFRELLEQVREVLLDAYAHQDLPFEQIVEALQPSRDLSHTPLFQVMFVLQYAPVAPVVLPGLTLRPLEIASSTTKFDLTLSLVETTRGLMGILEYRTDLLEIATIERMAAHLQTLLEGIVADPAQRLSKLPLLTRAEEHQLLIAWNAHQAPYPQDTCIHQLFEAQVERTPDAIAVVFDSQGAKEPRSQGAKESGVRSQESGVRSQESGVRISGAQSPIPHPPASPRLRGDRGGQRVGFRAPQSSVLSPQSLTYAELNRRANQLAHYLQALGVGPEVRVGLCVERSPNLIIGLLGALKAGGAYVPLDPTYPAERLAFMLDDAQVRVLITTTNHSETRPALSGNEGRHGDTETESAHDVTLSPLHPFTLSQRVVVYLDTDWGAIGQARQEDPQGGARANNLVYVVYTSGSTGRPKGVQVVHQSLCNLVMAQIRAFELRPDHRTLQFVSFSFDVAISDVFMTLIAGATLDLGAPDTRLLGPALIPLLRDHAITFMQTPPSALVMLPVADLPALRTLIVGGEPCPVDVVAHWGAGRQFFNLYGPTETTITATLTGWSDSGQSPPMGRPIANTQIYLLDGGLHPVPIGIPGEVYIGGAGVARGYLNRPDLTAERFIPNPFGGVLGDGCWVLEDSTPVTQHPTPNTRLYRTGDLARYRADGTLEFLGRIDQQVKIRGFRIELGEVEAALAEHPAIREAVVLAREDAPGHKRLVAYVVTSNKLQVTSREDSSLVTRHSLLVTQLRAFLKERLPEYMVPSVFVPLDALPLMSSGKVDRGALPASDQTRSALDDAFEAPRTPVEEVLAGIWAGVLGVDLVGAHDNFFALGGHSLLAAQLISRVRDTFQVELPLRHLFESPTVTGLAEQIVIAQYDARGLLPPPLRPLRHDGPLPLSYAQQRLWFLDQLEPNSAVYNVPATVLLAGSLDVAALHQSLSAVVRRHEALRTTFATVDGQPVQVIAAAHAVALPLIDLQALPERERQTAALRLATVAAQQPFDLARGPLLHATLLRLGMQEHVVLLIMHHIVSDGWSMGVLIREIAMLYTAITTGVPTALPELPIQYADYAVWQHAWLRGAMLETQLAYWKHQLGGAPAILELPTDHPRPAATTFQGAVHRFILPATLSEELVALSRREGVTLFMLLLAAFQVLLRYYTDRDDIVVGTDVANRTQSETEGLIGFFINQLVLRTDLSGDPTFQEVLGRVRDVALGAYAHQDVPFEKLVEALNPERNLQYSPLFQVKIILQNMPMPALELPGLTLTSLSIESKTAQFDLLLNMTDTTQGLIGSLGYNTDVFTAATATRIVGQYETLLRSIATQPDGAINTPRARISALEILGAVERQQLLLDFNDTQTDYPGDTYIYQLIEERAERTPDAIAVVFAPTTTDHRPPTTDAEPRTKNQEPRTGDHATTQNSKLKTQNFSSNTQHPTPNTRHLTYRELNARANQLAHYLREIGVGPDVLVALCTERSLELIVGILGILKAGGAYVPLDPSYPQERLAFMLADSQALVLLTQERLVGDLPTSWGLVVCLDAGWGLIAHRNEENPHSVVVGDNLAYMIYTSGSTGRPKGVLVTHQNLVHSTWARLTYYRDPVASFLLLSSFTFDSSVVGIFWTLCQGGRLILPPDSLPREVSRIAEVIAQQHASHVLSLPSLYALLLTQVPPQQLESLRTVIVAGEPCAGALIQRHQEVLPQTSLFNEYGPTESTVWSTVYDCRPPRPRAAVPIGRPIANMRIYLLDSFLRLAPIGVPGELYLGGAGLTRGYHNRPDLTAERFVPNPFGEGMGDRGWGMEDSIPIPYPPSPIPRLYKTGDLARYREDGMIEFFGRIDHQVKIRGYRIELEEIEVALSRHPAVRESVVLAREDVPGADRLVAYVVTSNKLQVTSREDSSLVTRHSSLVTQLRAFLKEKLPDYMVPAVFVQLEALPLMPNGKVDRHALPAPKTARPDVDIIFAAPRTPVEELLAQIWASVLGLERVGIRDNFFDLGGHSLLATQIISRAWETFHVELPIRDVFEAPTVEGLAARIVTALHDTAGLHIPPLRRLSREDALPLSYAQQRLWFLDQLQPNSPLYTIPIAVRLRGPLDVAALHQSLRAVVRRHETLRTTFATVDGQPVLMIVPSQAPPLPLIDLHALPEGEREATALQVATAEAQRAFALASGALFHTMLLRLAGEEHVILLTMHHIVSDAWSMGVLVREIIALYAAFAVGESAPLPDLPIQYADYAVWQRAWLQGAVLEAQLAYWRTQLADLPVLQLPTDAPRPPSATFLGASHTLVLPPALRAELLALSRAEGVTLFMSLLAAFQVLLARYSGQDDIAVGTPIAGRTRAETEPLIGFFVNMLVLRTDLGGAPTFRELLKRVRAVCLDAYTHQDVPFEQVVEAFQSTRDLDRHPLFQVIFTLQNAPMAAAELPDLILQPLTVEHTATQFDLSLSIEEAEARFAGVLEYRTDLFNAATIAWMLEHFHVLLESIVAGPEQRLADLLLLTAAEQQQLLVEWNATQAVYPRDQCVHHLFEAQAVRTPDAVAVVFDDRPPTNDQRPTTEDRGWKIEDRRSKIAGFPSSILDPRSSILSPQSLTYAELNRCANRLAHHLRSLGVGPEVRVGIALERSLELAVGLLGVLKAGGAYVPLDPAYPTERLAFMLADSQAPVLITTTDHRRTTNDERPPTEDRGWKIEDRRSKIAGFPSSILDPRSSILDPQSPIPNPQSPIPNPVVVYLDADWSTIIQQETHNTDGEVLPTHVAYVIYTSGSTGRPKGVLIAHQALVNYTLTIRTQFDLRSSDRFLQFASLSFDVLMEELFPTWVSGATVVLHGEELLAPGDDFVGLLAQAQVTAVELPAAYWQEWVYELVRSGASVPASLRLVIVGCEKPSPDCLTRWQQFGVPLIYVYGLTETTITSTLYHLPPGDMSLAPLAALPIGRPIANTLLYVLDGEMQPVPIGVPGLLYIGGAGLARGYLNRPDLTAERFVPNPFAEGMGDGGWGMEDAPPSPIPHPPSPGTRLYRTGDVVRYRRDGNLEFLGRRDEQVKVRGFRVELGEIEAVLRRHSAVREAVVVAREDLPGDKRLVAYLVTSDKSQVTSEGNDGLVTRYSPALSGGEGLLVTQVRGFLKAKLPDYMLPSAFVLLETLPLTLSGKVDRRALPPPDTTRSTLADACVAPRTPVEAVLAQIWADVLRVEQVGVYDSFFALGGHSLLATRLISRMRDAFLVQLPLRSLFETPTVAGLAEQIANARYDLPEVRPPALRPSPRGGPLPLSYAQQRLWFIDQIEPDSAIYNVPAAVRLTGPLDIAALAWSLRMVVRRHEALRTTITTVDGRPVQVIGTARAVPLPLLDLQALSADARETAARQLASAEAQRPFDLSRGPLLRVTLLRLGAAAHVALLTMHHIVSDAWSMEVLIREVTALYAASTTAQPASLPALPIQYADYAVWQRAWLQGSGVGGQASGVRSQRDKETGRRLETPPPTPNTQHPTPIQEQLDYWKRQLADLPALQLPTDHPRPAVPTFRGMSHAVVLPATLHVSLLALSRREGVTLFMTLLAAFQLLLARYSGQDDIAVGTPIANRTHAETEHLIGCFLNTLVLRTDLAGALTFRELLKRVRTICLDAYAHQDLPFEQVVEALQPARDLSRHPLFQIMFVLEHAPMAVPAVPGLTLSLLEGANSSAKFDLTLSLEENAHGLIGILTYSTDLFDSPTIARMATHFQILLEGIAAGLVRRLSELPLLTPVEERQLLVEWNTPRVVYPQELCIHDMFEMQATRAPHAVALVFEGEHLTYQKLNERANALGHHLRGLDVGPEIRVGLCVERSSALIVGLLGILKAGGAYVPLDPTYPQERLAFMLTDAQAPVLLTQQRLGARLPRHAAQIVVDTGWETVARADGELRNGVTADNLAYVIYTSGSTGVPKGVLVPHRGVCNLAAAQVRAFDVRPDSRVLQFASVSFDAMVSEVFMTLVAGATLVLAPQDRLLPGPDLIDMLEADGITTVTLPPSLLAVLPVADLPALHTLIAAGEICAAGVVGRWVAGRRVINAYGPTEVTVCATIGVCEDDGRNPPIGHPLDNAQVYLLDRHLRPVPIGVPAELYVGGVGVTRGYHNRPALTAERFIPNPFVEVLGDGCWVTGDAAPNTQHPTPNTRLYKTGDLARYRLDGAIEYLGRLDQQVKIHGYRIELGEIEATLAQHPAVRETVVLAWEELPGERRLVAYVVTSDKLQVTSSQDSSLVTELRSFLQSQLPAFMAPAVFVLLDALPRSPSGKLDRRRLPAPAPTRPALASTFLAPRSPLEAILAAIWAEVLHLEAVGVHDNFFALGGDSILSLQIVARASAAGLSLNPKHLFQHQTVAQLAALAATATRPRSAPLRLAGPAPLTPIQHWFVAQALPEPQHFNQALLLEVRVPLDSARLEQALQLVLRHHDALRLRLRRTAAGWQQESVALPRAPLVRRVELAGLTQVEQGAALATLATMLQSSLDLAAGSLVRVVLFTHGQARSSRLLIIIHHLAVDGVSWRIVLEDLQSVYQQLSQGAEPALPPPSTAFVEWAERLAAYAQSAALHHELAYWLDKRRASVRHLPRDEAGGANIVASARSLAIALSAQETAALLREVPAAYHTQINDVLLTALAQTLAAWSGAKTLLIDLEGHGREDLFDDVDLSRTVGWCTTLFPVLLDLEGVAGLAAALKVVKEQLRAVPKRGIGYGVLRYLSSEAAAAGLRQQPEAEVSFNYLGQLDQAMPTGLFWPVQEPSGAVQNGLGRRSHLLEVSGIIAGGQLHLEWTYSAQMHHRATIERLAQEYLTALRALIAHCQAPDAGGFTPSDFPEMSFSQKELDDLIEEFSESLED